MMSSELLNSRIWKSLLGRLWALRELVVELSGAMGVQSCPSMPLGTRRQRAELTAHFGDLTLPCGYERSSTHPKDRFVKTPA